MKYIQTDSVKASMPTARMVRLRKLRDRLTDAKDAAKSNVGPMVFKVYDADNNLSEWREDTGWVDVVDKH
jgi:hypothetical protein